MPSIYDQHLARNAANFVALSSVTFVERSAEVYVDLPAVVAMLGSTHLCLRRVEAKAMLDAMRLRRVDHCCAAPLVHSLVYNAPQALRDGIGQQVRGMVARPDVKGGETPVAFVELKAGAVVTAAALVAHCKGLLAGYMLPREIRFEDIPKTFTGKIQKFQLRDRARSDRALD